MWACEHGFIDIVRMLLEKDGLDVKEGDDTGESPLIVATRNDHDEIVQMLLRYQGVETGLR